MIKDIIIYKNVRAIAVRFVPFVKSWPQREGETSGLGAIRTRHGMGTPDAVPRRAKPHRPRQAASHGAAQRLVARLGDLFNAPVGNKPYDRNSNIEYDRDPRLNKGQQNRRGVERE